MQKPNEFRVTISNCGTNNCNAGHGKRTSKNAESLLFCSSIDIAEDLVGKEYMNSLLYDVALDILKHLSKEPEKFNLQEKLIDFDKRIEKWNIKEK